MANEIEAKMKVDDLEAVRRRLKNAGAKAAGEHLETNTYFDTARNSLRRGDKGFRLRANRDVKSGRTEYIVTFKGPRQRGLLKTRQEIEFSVDDPQKATEFFHALGFEPMLAFQKRRRSWTLGGCKVELDQLPHIGSFVEIEGPAARKILAVRNKLALADLPMVKEGYAALLDTFLKTNKIASRSIKLDAGRIA